MKLIIDVDEDLYKRIVENTKLIGYSGDAVYDAVVDGVPLTISADDTLIITVDDATKVGRVLVQDNKHNGGLFYASSD